MGIFVKINTFFATVVIQRYVKKEIWIRNIVEKAADNF